MIAGEEVPNIHSMNMANKFPVFIISQWCLDYIPINPLREYRSFGIPEKMPKSVFLPLGGDVFHDVNSPYKVTSFWLVLKKSIFWLVLGCKNIMIFLQFEAPFTSEISQLAMFDSQKVIDTINPHQFPLTWLVDSESTIIVDQSTSNTSINNPACFPHVHIAKLGEKW